MREREFIELAKQKHKAKRGDIYITVEVGYKKMEVGWVD